MQSIRSRTGRRVLVLATAMTLAGLMAAGRADGSEGRLIEGEKVALFGGAVSSWARLGAGGAILEAGITIPYAVIENAPAEHAHAGGQVDAVVPFPAEVREASFLDHLGLFWEPHGHPPEGRYTTPHFDFHFFGIPAGEAAAIDCARPEQRDPALTPAGWVPAVPPGADPAEFCVPLMGYHVLPETEFTSPGVFQPELFDQVMIAGEYGGEFIFLEPMITKAVLERKESLAMPVPLGLGRGTLYPTRFEVLFDRDQDAYRLVFSGFEALS